MIKQRNLKEHRRKNSQFHCVFSKETSKSKNKSKIPSRKNSKKLQKNGEAFKNLNAEDVHSLIQKSMSKVAKKHVIVQDIDQPSNDIQDEEFFRFGKKTAKDFNIKMPPMQQIEEVPDTGSYSQRNTQGKIQNKQNNKNVFNRHQEAEPKCFKLALQKIEEKRDQRGALSHRQIHNRSKRSQTKSSRSHNCSQSTVELARAKSSKSKSKQRIKTKKNINRMIRMEKQITMIWQCIGDLWQGSKINKKISEENSMYLSELINKTQSQERDIIELKLKCDGKIKNT